MFKAAPLKSSFMLAAILGLVITTIYTYSGRISTDWGVSLGIVFACMFIASLISMRKAPIDSQLEYSRGFVHAADENAGMPAKPKVKSVSLPRPKPRATTKVRTTKARAKPKKSRKKSARKPVKKAKPKKAAKKPARKARPKKAAKKK